MKILLADDEKELNKALSAILKFNKYEVDSVYDGEAAFKAAVNNDYDALIFDIMMPKMNGVDALKKLRSKNIDTPAIFLTAKSEFSDRIEGLDAGADDYLTKPFNTGELMARLRAITRRKSEKHDITTCGNVSLNKDKLEIKTHSSSLRLATHEYETFELLVSKFGTPVSEKQLIETVFAEEENTNGVVFLYISYLRAKLKSIGANLNITTTDDNKYLLTEAANV